MLILYAMILFAKFFYGQQMKDEIHIGKMISDKMKEEGRSVHWLAEKSGCSSSNIYKIYEKSNMDIMQLLHISRILNHNFFNDFSLLSKNNIDQ